MIRESRETSQMSKAYSTPRLLTSVSAHTIVSFFTAEANIAPRSLRASTGTMVW